jgi:hypothetical protein
VPTTIEEFDLGVRYRLARERLSSLVAGLDDPKSVRVPACPLWSAHDVVCHLTAVAEDALAGKLTGPPSEEESAEQVARRSGTETREVLVEWSGLSDEFEKLIQAVRIFPGYLDVLAHEHDLRGALNDPGGRESDEMEVSAEWLIEVWKPSIPVLVKMSGREFARGPDQAGDLTLSTTAFEAFRFRLGRRSVAQLRQMDWSGDPAPVLDELTIFGPEPYDIWE